MEVHQESLLQTGGMPIGNIDKILHCYNKTFSIVIIIAFAGIFIFNSCQKEISCEGCILTIRKLIVTGH